MHFTFGIPQGATGAEGPQGLPGEVTQTDLNNAVAAMLGESSANSNGVGNLSMNADPAYDQNQMQAVMVKLDELSNALQRCCVAMQAFAALADKKSRRSGAP
jgi:hypothetical protein